MPHPHRTLATVAFCFALAGLAACDNVKAPGSARLDPLQPEQYPRITVLEGLDKGLRFQEPTVVPAEDKRPMSVSVPVRSVVDKYGLNLQYRFQWFDQNNRLLNPGEGWAYKPLIPRAQDFLAGNALDTRAVDWRLQVRPAR